MFCLCAVMGCGSASPQSTQSPAEPIPGRPEAPEHAPKHRIVSLSKSRCVCYVMRNDKPLLVVWCDAVAPDAVAAAGDIPADDILESLSQDFLPEKVVLKSRNPENPNAPERDYNREITLAPYGEKNSVQLVFVDYGKSVLTHVFDLNDGALFVVSVKGNQVIHQLKHDVHQMQFEPESLAEYSREHPEIEAVFTDARQKD